MAPERQQAVVYELVTERYGARELEVVSIRGVEQISKPYSFEILVYGASIDAPAFERDLLGQPATLWLRWAEDEARPVHGIVRRVEAEGISGGGEHRHRFRVWLAPRLWLLSKGQNSRIFQDRTVPQIVEAVLAERHVPCAFRLLGLHAPRRYCVQHQESDLAFVRRLLAEEGIFYSFEHPADSDRELVVCSDGAHLCSPIAGSPELTFRDSGGMMELDEDVRRFRLRGSVAPGVTLLKEFDFLRPSLDLSARAAATAVEGAFDASQLRFYDHHGEFEGVVVDARAAALHLEQHRVRAAVGEGESRCRRLTPGRWFSLAGDALPSLDGRYTLVRVEHEGHQPETARSGTEVRDVYKNRFFCVPEGIHPRPRRPKRRHEQVMETATVTGPAGQEIHTDEHGRIKVQFHWDREGLRNEHSSCWIRTMQAWAGTGWGFQFIPRIGMEVVVMFLAGDADRPMVLGSVYNAEHPPPFPLPASKTKSGIRTQTSRGGGGYNELSFEDRADYERVYLHAQRDHEMVVRRDQITRVGNNRTEQVTANRYTIVTGNDLTSIGGNQTRSVAADESVVVVGSRSSRVEGSALEVVSGPSEVRVGEDLRTRIGGAEHREVTGATDLKLHEDLMLRVHGTATTLVGEHDARRSYVLRVEGVTDLSSSGPTEISSETGLLLRCGKSFIHMTPERIEIVSPTVAVQASGASVTVGDDEVKLESKTRIVGVSDDKILFKSSGASVSLTADAKIDGAAVKLKCPDSASLGGAADDSDLTTIELVDDDGNPIAYQRYLLVLGNGERRSGMLDKDGKAEILLDESATVTFPGLASVETA